MIWGDLDTNVYQLFNTKFSVLLFIYLENEHLARNLQFAGVELLLSELWTQKCLDVSLNYRGILAQMWPNLARTGLQKYAACRQRSLPCYRSAKL